MACAGTSANGIVGIPVCTGDSPPPGGPPPPPPGPPPGPPSPPPGAGPPPPPCPAWAGTTSIADACTGTCPVGVVVVVVPIVATMLAWVFINCAEEARSNTSYGRIFLWKVYRSRVWALWINQYLVDFNL